MAFKDLDEYLVVAPVVLPIHGKDYSFPGPGDISARAGLLLQRLQAAAPGDANEIVLSDAEDQALRAEVFGGSEPQLVADGLTFAQIRAVYFTLIACHLYGVEAGELVWANQGEPPAPNRETRRAKPSRPRGSRAASSGPKKKASPGDASSTAGTS